MNSLVCVDASFIIRALGGHPLSLRAIALLEKWQQEQKTIIAPAHIDYEVMSTLRRFVYLKALEPEEGDSALAEFLRLKVNTTANRKLLPLAWKIAKRFNRPRAYDATYLALAQLRQCEFWTADKRIYNAVSDKLPWVRLLGT